MYKMVIKKQEDAEIKEDSRAFQMLMGGYKFILKQVNKNFSKELHAEYMNQLAGYEMALGTLGYDVDHVKAENESLFHGADQPQEEDGVAFRDVTNQEGEEAFHPVTDQEAGVTFRSVTDQLQEEEKGVAFCEDSDQEDVPFKNWKRSGYQVQERPFDHDLHCFDVMSADREPFLIATITPATIDDMNLIKRSLNDGADVDGWEDGMGRTINLAQYGIGGNNQ